jgi:hypothetical protein
MQAGEMPQPLTLRTRAKQKPLNFHQHYSNALRDASLSGSDLVCAIFKPVCDSNASGYFTGSKVLSVRVWETSKKKQHSSCKILNLIIQFFICSWIFILCMTMVPAPCARMAHASTAVANSSLHGLSTSGCGIAYALGSKRLKRMCQECSANILTALKMDQVRYAVKLGFFPVEILSNSIHQNNAMGRTAWRFGQRRTGPMDVICAKWNGCAGRFRFETTQHITLTTPASSNLKTWRKQHQFQVCASGSVYGCFSVEINTGSLSHVVDELGKNRTCFAFEEHGGTLFLNR